MHMHIYVGECVCVLVYVLLDLPFTMTLRARSGVLTWHFIPSFRHHFGFFYIFGADMCLCFYSNSNTSWQ